MKRIFLIFIFALVLAGLLACEDTNIEFDGYSSRQVGFLLSGDSIKTWKRQALIIGGQSQEITDCQQNLHLTFEIIDTEDETDSIATQEILPLNGCAPETIFSASWQVAAGPQDDTLFFQLDDALLTRYISSLTSQRLEYYYLENNVRITEVFSATD